MPDVMKTVGRYEILREVGRGGMAMVYLARQTDLDRFVALKELGAFHASDPSFAQRFLRESRVAGSLSHPNICTVHDYFEHEGTPYIAMEYIERGSLRPYVGTMNQAQIGGVLEGLLAGLAHGEQHGIVHRDLKPENLMVTSDGRVKIADFGIAKATNQMQTGAFLTATGTTVGTPTYMAPEQAMAQDIGPPTDLYSVGCMAFEMFTGRVPFHDTEAPMAILLRHVNEQIPSVKSIDPKIDQDISDWIERMLVKDPTKRTQNANDAWDEFEEIIIGLLGPRWRREARLREGSAQFDTPAPLTPAPFQGTTSDAAVSDQFQSFAWGNAVTPEAPPGPDTPPPSDSAPLPPEPTVGPPTPAPGPAVESGREPRRRVRRRRLRDVRRPRRAGGRARGAAGGRGRGAAEARAARARLRAADRAAGRARDRAAGGSGGFETYIAPAPLRPPTDDDADRGAGDPEPTPAPEPTPDPEPVAAAPPPPAAARAGPGADAASDARAGPGAAAPARRGGRPRATVMPSSIKPPPPAEPKPPEVEAPAAAAPPPPKEPDKPKEPEGAEGRSEVRQGRPHRHRGRGRDRRRRRLPGRRLRRRGRAAAGGKPTAAASNADVEALFPSGLDQGLERTADPRHDASEPVAMKPPGPRAARASCSARSRRAPPTRRCCRPASSRRSASTPVRCRRARRSSSRARSCRRTATRTCARAGSTTRSRSSPSPPPWASPRWRASTRAADCEAIADTLKLNAGTAFPVGPSKDYAAGARQGARRPGQEGQVRAQRRCAGAKTPKAQARGGRGPRVGVQRRVGGGRGPQGLACRRGRERAARRRAQGDRGGLRQARRGGQVGQQERLREGAGGPCSRASRRSRGRCEGSRRRATRSPREPSGPDGYPFVPFPKPGIHATY